ncbi:MAG TPA: C25 family cysteine peptidase [Phycisphaerales bacterium]|nr:C25 family cysteine peptidase [Phycisphaerales bacterium]
MDRVVNASSRLGRPGTLAALAGLALCAGIAAAQPAPPRWVALDSSARPGTPPSVEISPASTEDKTILTISIPGFYVEDVIQPGFGTFQKLSIPTNPDSALLLPAVQKIREAAAVPVINMLVGIPSDAAGCTVGTITPISSMAVHDLRIIPAQPDVMEEETIDPADQPPFAYDPAAYASTLPYPAENGTAITPPGRKSGIRLQGMSVKPFKYIAAAKTLNVHSKFSVVIDHPGDPLPQTKEHILLARQVQNCTVNWDTPAAPWITEHIDYKGAFLFITKADVVDDLRPLVQQKQARGYTTRVATEEHIDTDHDGLLEASEIRSYIKGWYDDHDEESLKYVILVGDVTRIPNTVDPFYGYPSDLFYACYEDDDFFADMGLGRITFNAGQLPDIVSRIIRYEDAPPGQDEYYSRSAAVAHGEVAAHFASVLDDSISIPFPASEPMTFTKLYGTDPVNGHNSSLMDALNAGQHIVYYRGHGSPSTFFEWSSLGANFYDWHLTTDNFPVHPAWCPIVISSACANAALGDSDCILEEWFQRPENGAVASYGALIGSRRDMNHGFTEMFWKYLRSFGKTGTIFSHTEWSQIMGYLQEYSPDMEDPAKNIWTYTLLGDPEMKIWARKPDHAAPDSLPPHIIAEATSLDLTIKNGHGDPVPGAVVCAFKEGEVQETRYADAAGKVSLNIQPTTGGLMTLCVYTYDDKTQPTLTTLRVGACAADVDGTGFVDTDDFDFFVRDFEAGVPAADFDQSGFVDTDDFDAFVHAFERGC